MDNIKTLGTKPILANVRDAVHLPIISIEATETLNRGDLVTLTKDNKAAKGNYSNYIGVVDPNLFATIYRGDIFWLWLKPGSISTLTHQWTHSAFNDKLDDPKKLAEKRVRAFAKKIGMTYEQVLGTIEYVANGGEPRCENKYQGQPGSYVGLFEDYCLLTGNPDPRKNEEYFYFFSCGGCSENYPIGGPPELF